MCLQPFDNESIIVISSCPRVSVALALLVLPVLHAEATKKHNVVRVHEGSAAKEALLVRDLHGAVGPPGWPTTAVRVLLAAALAGPGRSVHALRGDDGLQPCWGSVLGQEGSAPHGHVHGGRGHQQRFEQLPLALVDVQSQPCRILPLVPLGVPPRASPMVAPLVIAPRVALLVPGAPATDLGIVGLRLTKVSFLPLCPPAAPARMGIGLLAGGLAVHEPCTDQLLAQRVPGAQQPSQALRHKKPLSREAVRRLGIFGADTGTYAPLLSQQLLLEALRRGVAGQEVARGVEASLVPQALLPLAGRAHKGPARGG
mmetsp:Transcript_27180/g.74751  ORF Transcript_27180/g.74751 Transcript_27180/m.74751 type:complete len:314 (-) Transcript_27180:1437-2378(-)